MTVTVSTIGLLVASIASFMWWYLVFNVFFGKIYSEEKGNKLELEATWLALARNIITSFVSKVIQVNVLIHTMVYASVFYTSSQVITMANGLEAWLWLWLGFCVVSYFNDMIWDNFPKRKVLWINAIGSLVMIVLPVIVYVLLQNY